MEPVHFAAPFSIGRAGTATVEQGSAENVADNIYNIAVCPQGERDDNPQFGIPEITFKKMPVDLTGLEEALRKYEPEADLTVEQHREGVGRAGITINATP